MDVKVRRVREREVLERGARRARDGRQRERCRCVLLALQGFEATQIADKLGRSRRFVQYWVYRYRDGGLAALADRPRAGQPTRLPRPREAEFRARLEAAPTAADGVCSLRGRDIVRILRDEFGATYTLQGAYDLLHRLGYSYLRPRPQHRKNDPQAMDVWLGGAPLLSSRSATSTPPRRSKSGSRTKPASDRRAP
jgi:transposase